MGLQDRAQALATGLRGMDCAVTFAAIEAAALEVKFPDRAAALADEQRTQATISSETSANSSQSDGLSRSAMVISLNNSQGNGHISQERVSKR
jgi:hypothetical protein